LKEEALDRSMLTARFGKGFGPVVRRQTAKWRFGVLSPRKTSFHKRTRGNKWRLAKQRASHCGRCSFAESSYKEIETLFFQLRQNSLVRHCIPLRS